MLSGNGQRGSRISDSLSDRSRSQCKRRERVSLQINILGWITESIGQWILVPIYVVFGGHNLFISTIILPFYLLFQGVLVPFTILLNETRIKSTILKSGWSSAIKSVLGFKQNSVNPHPTNNMEMDLRNGIDSNTNRKCISPSVSTSIMNSSSVVPENQTIVVSQTSTIKEEHSDDIGVDRTNNIEVLKGIAFVDTSIDKNTSTPLDDFLDYQSSNAVKQGVKRNHSSTTIASNKIAGRNTTYHDEYININNQKSSKLDDILILQPKYYLDQNSSITTLKLEAKPHFPSTSRNFANSNEERVRFCLKESISFFTFCRKEMIDCLINATKRDEIKYRQLLSYLLVLEK